jgi:ubiquinone/menaquinone biosynthesis C-methylase UbiE
MSFDIHDWHERFRQQTRWTEAIRTRWFDHIGLPEADNILEVGCGTGALLEKVRASPTSHLIGADRIRDRLAYAAYVAPHSSLLQADALALPFASAQFDIVLTQFFFLWQNHPRVAALEMRRVLRPCGYLLALAEPDYGARIDFPDELAPIGQRQAMEIHRQGADLLAGRKIASELADAGFMITEACILGSQWSSTAGESGPKEEWEMLEEDLADESQTPEMMRLASQDQVARKTGSRVLFIPTFSVLAQKPK